MASDFAASAAGEQGEDAGLLRDAKFGASSARVRRGFARVGRAGGRCRWSARRGRVKNFSSKGQDAQQAAQGSAHGFDAVLAPRPGLRGDQLDDGDALG